MESWGVAEWVLAVATVLGVLVSIGFGIWGLWARKHPRRGQLLYSINESSLVPTNASAQRLKVLFDGSEIEDPYVAVIELVNAGPGDLGPAAFAGGGMRLFTVGEEGDASPRLRGNLSAEVEGTLSGGAPEMAGVHINPPPFYPSHFEVAPLQIKKGRTATITLLSSGKPNLALQASLTDIDLAPLKKERSDGFDVDLVASVMGFPLSVRLTPRS